MKKSMLILAVFVAANAVQAQEKTTPDSTNVQEKEVRKFEKATMQTRVGKKAKMHTAAFEKHMKDASAPQAIKPEDEEK